MGRRKKVVDANILASIAKYAESGLTAGEASALVGLSPHYVHVLAKNAGLKFVRAKKKPVPDARAIVMRDAYLSGRTLVSIGDEYGVTRERVRQVITKYFRRLRTEGGASFIARKAKEHRLAFLDAEARDRWGCTRREYAVLKRMTKRLVEQGVTRERTPIGAFARQRNSARRRGIGWEISLWDWWTIWQKSGKWSRRGRCRGQFVMCRKGDVGPYSRDNVFVALHCENVSSANRKNNLPIGVVAMSSGYAARTVLNRKQTILGVYDTPEQAHIAYLRSLSLEAA